MERDRLLQQSRADVGRYLEEIGIRKQHQEALAKALARREAEIATMRVQVVLPGAPVQDDELCMLPLAVLFIIDSVQINNHRLGTVVQKFSGTMAEGVIDSFEPAFAYHQLQQVRCFTEEMCCQSN